MTCVAVTFVLYRSAESVETLLMSIFNKVALKLMTQVGEQVPLKKKKELVSKWLSFLSFFLSFFYSLISNFCF